MAMYAVFEDGQRIERGFHIRADAEKRAARLRRLEPASTFEVQEVCPDHPDSQDPRSLCEECWA